MVKKLRRVPGEKNDAIVRVSKAYSDENMTVLELFEDLRSLISPKDSYFRREAVRNERYFHNLVSEENGSSVGDVDGGGFFESITSRASRNYLRNMVMTWASRVNEDRPIIKAYPVHPGKDVPAAKLADALIKEFHWRENLDSKLWDAAVYAQLHGKVCFKVTWDPDGGRDLIAPVIDEETGFPETGEDGQPIMESVGKEGDVAFDVVTVFDYEYFGADTIEDADGACFISHVTRSQARAELHAELGEWVDVSEEEYDTAAGGMRTGVRVEELWIRPGPIVEEGLFAVIIGGHVARATTFPYEHGMLPAAEWRINPVRGTSMCTSHVSDAIPLQRLINELEKVKVETVLKTGVPRLLGVSEIAAELQAGVHTILVDDIQQVQQGARYLEPPDPAELVFGQQQEATQAMFDTFGLNEVLVGKDSVKSGTSAKQIAYLSRLDSMKLSGAVRSMESAYIRAIRMFLMLSQQFIKVERLARLAGEGESLAVKAFTGADLRGADVWLEPNSGLDKFRAQAEQEAMEDLRIGAISPDEAAERAQTGLGESLGNAADRQRAEEIVMRAVTSGQPVFDQSINPLVAIQAISEATGLNPQADAILRQMLAKYREALSQQQAKMQGGGPTKVPGAKSLPAPNQKEPEPMIHRDRPG